MHLREVFTTMPQDKPWRNLDLGISPLHITSCLKAFHSSAGVKGVIASNTYVDYFNYFSQDPITALDVLHSDNLQDRNKVCWMFPRLILT
jgi:hypothetical protein